MSAEDAKGFVIRDKRGRGDEAPASERPASAETSRRPSPQGEPAPSGEHLHEPMPVTFSSFAFSLGTSALMLMGEKLDPQQPPMPANLPQAKEIIDILSMLEEKTRGNLTDDEQRVLTDMLYALRMKYVDLASGPGGRQSATPSS